MAEFPMEAESDAPPTKAELFAEFRQEVGEKEINTIHFQFIRELVERGQRGVPPEIVQLEVMKRAIAQTREKGRRNRLIDLRDEYLEVDA